VDEIGQRDGECVGDGPEREYLERLADGVDADITFIGEVPPDRVPEYLLSSTLLVLPAVDGEGLPNVLLEAMAHGVPVVSTTVAGIPDVVQDGETGYVVPPDDVDALADRIRRVCEDDAHRAELADNARTFVESEYAWDRLLAELDDVYESVAG
jgi:glycosyltransferase involved in cell wall biosynthesis